MSIERKSIEKLSSLKMEFNGENDNLWPWIIFLSIDCTVEFIETKLQDQDPKSMKGMVRKTVFMTILKLFFSFLSVQLPFESKT